MQTPHPPIHPSSNKLKAHKNLTSIPWNPSICSTGFLLAPLSAAAEDAHNMDLLKIVPMKFQYQPSIHFMYHTSKHMTSNT
jgi:hypothetical protein